MKFQFLCQKHLQWLQANPESAANTWLQAYDTALELIGESELNRAVNHAGAAMEAAEIGLVRREPHSHTEINRFAESCLLLAQLLREQGQAAVATAVIRHGLVKLQELIIEGVERHTILEGCNRLAQMGDQTVMPLSLYSGRRATSPEKASRRIH